ncbi:MAC/perforin domain-containing protein [Bacillus altitudinis]|uniref:MAC/perforin domain-containing protein n=1 Tax=Bacillus altitudinis TaxID=293387 RepID=UPI0010716A86|nr:MAC/perforin domain-containing protein [Bacillus altitudinis]MEC2040285.1 MAC/perforin domain-containing protein [Bacillus altitudinis]QEO62404.1 hypothetical protein EVS87_009345 [Bacillus altitudinis]
MSSEKNTVPDVPGLDVLGYGYDVFGRYANTQNATRKLFNLGEMVLKNIDNKDYNIPKCVNFRFINENSLQIFSGETLSEYMSALNNILKVDGNYNFFSGSLEVDFNKKFLTKSNYAFTKVLNSIQKWILSLPDESILVSLYMDEIVKKDLEELTPENLFDKYGTHYLQEIIVGAKATYNTVVNKLLYESEFSISTMAQMSYKYTVNSISASDKLKYEESIKNYKRFSEETLHTFGGRPEYSSNIKNGSYDKWIESIEENAVFCDFAPKGLKPIWNLCTNPDRKKVLIDAFSSYAKSKEKKIGQPCINGLDIIYSSKPDVEPPNDYIRINYDLNKGHGHDYLYICYRNGLDNDEANLPITDIKVIVSDEELTKAPDERYTLIRHDLNAGLGSKTKYIYIAYTQNTQLGLPIRGISLIYGDTPDVPAPSGYTKIPVDLKQSAGGEYVYICTSMS